MSLQHAVVESPSCPQPPSRSRRPRCSHLSRNARPCRYSAEPGSDLCKRHLASPASPDEALAAELLSAAGSLSSPADVNRLMRAVLQAMVQHRLSPKEAGILCYISQTILHSQRASFRHELLEAKAQQQAEQDQEDEDDKLIPDNLTWNLPTTDWIESHPREYAAIQRRCARIDQLRNSQLGSIPSPETPPSPLPAPSTGHPGS